MKILLVSTEMFLADGGIARIMRLYLKALCEIYGPDGRVDSTVLNDDPSHDPRLPRYTNNRLGVHVGCARSKARFILQNIRLARVADVLICSHIHHLVIGWLAKILNPKLKYYLVAHGFEVWRPFSWIERGSLLRAHRIFCVSEYTRQQMLHHLPALSPERLVVVLNTLDPYFTPRGTDAPENASISTPRILTVSRLTTPDIYKGVDTMIQAMPRIVRDFPSAQLRIVGGGNDLPRLRNLAAQIGVADAVNFTGFIDDEALRAEYAACDLFALPSRKEGFGLVFLEAMTYGKQCLGARAGGIPEVVNETVGQLVEYGDVPAIAAAVAELVRHPRDSAVVRRHADSFAFPAFQRRLAEVLR